MGVPSIYSHGNVTKLGEKYLENAFGAQVILQLQVAAPANISNYLNSMVQIPSIVAMKCHDNRSWPRSLMQIPGRMPLHKPRQAA